MSQNTQPPTLANPPLTAGSLTRGSERCITLRARVVDDDGACLLLHRAVAVAVAGSRPAPLARGGSRLGADSGCMSSSAVVVLRDVVVRFGRTVVLDGVSLSLGSGEIVGVRGSNGAGKTTLLRLLVNAYRPHAGARVGPRRSAYVPATIEPPALAAGVWLERMPRTSRSDPIVALDLLGFDGDLGSPCRALSFGNLRKLLLAEAFSAGEQLVVVDEVSAGLDDAGLAGVRTLIERAVASSTTVVLADQESRPFPPGTPVVRIARGSLIAEASDPVVDTVTLRGPLASRRDLLDRAAEFGYAPVDDEQ